MSSSFTPEDVTDLNEADLLYLVAQRDESKEDGMLAMAELYKRHFEFLSYKACSFLEGFPETEFDPAGLISLVFWSIDQKKVSSYDATGLNTPKSHASNFRLWAFGIAKNTFRDYLRKRAMEVPTTMLIVEDDESDEGYDSLNDVEDTTAKTSDSEDRVRYNIQLVKECIDTLKPKEQIIARTIWQAKSRKSGKTPTSVLQGLADMFSITIDGVRKIEHRLRQKIRDQLKEKIK
jgi:RNA polymerase sigma factor (sigma-70 family)